MNAATNELDLKLAHIGARNRAIRGSKGIIEDPGRWARNGASV